MLLLLAIQLAQVLTPVQRATPPQLGWFSHAGNGQHVAQTGAPTQSLQRIVWSTPVDLNPRYSGDDLLTHYGTPCVSSANTVVVPVKQDVDSGFAINAVRGKDGTTVWTASSDYVMPPHGWTPSFGPCISKGQAIWPMAGGRIAYRNVDAADAPVKVKAFYGDYLYAMSPQSYNDWIRICTPLTPGPDGNIYFGFQVLHANRIGLRSGIARVGPKGSTWIAATDASGDTATGMVKQNCAPAVTASGDAVYITVCTGGFGRGYLLKLDGQTLKPIAKAPLLDPKSSLNALIDDAGTSCPMIAPDGDVYYGVYANSSNSNNARGWMLHFSGDLSQKKIPGAFGWDDTASVVPSSIVPLYKGTSPYLIVTKYNNYRGFGTGNGVNKIALLDPFDSSVEPVSGIRTMTEVATIKGLTTDNGVDPLTSPAVREWCVNSAVVDIKGQSVILNSEDGVVYRWDLKTFNIYEKMRLTEGIGEAYTPTFIGTDGMVYAISNARLYAVGNNPKP